MRECRGSSDQVARRGLATVTAAVVLALAVSCAGTPRPAAEPPKPAATPLPAVVPDDLPGAPAPAVPGVAAAVPEIVYRYTFAGDAFPPAPAVKPVAPRELPLPEPPAAEAAAKPVAGEGANALNEPKAASRPAASETAAGAAEKAAAAAKAAVAEKNATPAKKEAKQPAPRKEAPKVLKDESRKEDASKPTRRLFQPVPALQDNPETTLPALTMTGYVGEPLKVSCLGTGWIYLGETKSREGLFYDSREIAGGMTVFSFNPTKEGPYELRFQKQDLVRDSMTVQLVRVDIAPGRGAATATAGSTPATTVAAGGTATPAEQGATAARKAESLLLPQASGTVSSPSVAQSSTDGAVQGVPTASGSPERAAAGGATGNADAAGGNAAAAAGTTGSGTAAPVLGVAPQTGGQTSAAQPQQQPQDPNSPENLITAAKNAIAANQLQSALNNLDTYVKLYPVGSDEVYFLYGSIYEMNTPIRNVKKAYEYYKKVRDEYPESRSWNAANDRIRYIERHYFTIY